MKTYNPKLIETKWAQTWDKTKAFKVDIKNAKKPFYNLAMFPYPSGEGLHMGHIIPYSGVDTYGRYLRMNGLDVFEPMGFDAFGIHSENFSIKKGIHPKTLIANTTEYFREKQMKRLGTLFDWDREVNTTDPNYYKWTQWLFVQMFKHGLAQKRKAPVTYCPSCQTVLSDEQTETVRQPQGLTDKTPGVSVTVCERCKTPIERKELEQWFFKITKYADKLLNNLNSLNHQAFGATKAVSQFDQEHGINWSEKTKNAQRNWIGKSEGINITYKVDGTDETITCFTTRPDTNFGATFIVLAPEHPFVKWVLSSSVIPSEHSESRDLLQNNSVEKDSSTSDAKRLSVGMANKEEISSYVKKATSKSEIDRIAQGKEKTGVFTGFYAINNLNDKKIPIWISDFAIATVGTGAVVGVPGHDLRDFEFAKKFNLPINVVVLPEKTESGKDTSDGVRSDTCEVEELKEVYEGEGVVVNSGFLNGLPTAQAKIKIMDHFEQKGWGKRIVHFKLRDWCISRQRYWGPPIPMINCPKCSWQPVPEKDLPVLLPFLKDYKPTGDGKSPLARDEKFCKAVCPECGGPARRETDVSDTFLDSAWYFLRYPSVGYTPSVIPSERSESRDLSQINSVEKDSSARPYRTSVGMTKKEASNSLPWDPEVTRRWLPVDMYIGGHEHAVLHLMYSRFVTMALKDMGFIDFEEPFIRFFAHGLMTSEGSKMSKSKGNVVNPNQYMDKYGSDTLRMYILFMGPYDAGSDFKMTGIAGMHKFLKRIWTLVNSHLTESGKNTSGVTQGGSPEVEELDKRLLSKMHQTIKKVGEDISNLHFNTAIAGIMEYYNVLSDASSVSQEAIKTLLLLLAPFAPFITEELWQQVAIKTPPRWQAERSEAMTPRTVEELGSIHSQSWPKFDPKFPEEEEVTIVIQVNGKIRDKIQVKSQTAKDKSEIEKLAMASDKVQHFLNLYPAKSGEAGRSGAKKSIFVPGKLINFVV